MNHSVQDPAHYPPHNPGRLTSDGPDPKARPFRPLRGALAAAAVLALSACANLSPDSGFSSVQKQVQTVLGPAQQEAQELSWARNAEQASAKAQRVQALLGAEITADAAVQLALLNNRGLQADYQALALADTERAQAGRLPNPGISLARMRRGDEVEIEQGLHFGLGRLLAWPLIQRLEARRFEQAQAQAATAVLNLAAQVRKAWVQAVAAQASVSYMHQVMEAAEASAELAKRMAQVGNFSKLQQSREQAFHADAALNLARAQQQQVASRERLIRLLGLWGEQLNFKLPERLPDLPTAAHDWPDVESRAVAQRLDLRAAKAHAAQLAEQLGMSERMRWVNGLEVGASRGRSNEEPTQRGWEIGLELPLFDWGDVRVARAQAQVQQALHRAAHAAVTARSEVREAYAQYRTAYDMARHQRDEIVPLRARIAEENLLRYNGMLIGVFELLADARLQIASVNAAIDAQRDFWLAQADLDMALVGTPALMGLGGGASMAPAEGGAGH